MITILLVLQVFVTLALIGIVLIQRSEGGGLGLGTSQGMGGFMTGRGTANLLTRTTAVLAAAFMGISLTLALLYKHSTEGSGSAAILNTPPAAVSTKAPAKSKPAGAGLPAVPGGPGASGGSANGGNVEINLPQRPAEAGVGAAQSSSPPSGGQGSGSGPQGGSAPNALPIPGMSSGAASSGASASSGSASTNPSSK